MVTLIRKNKNLERGSGAGEILGGLAVVSILWFSFLGIADWIYYTKENRKMSSWEYQQQALLKGKNMLERGPGGYQVTCFSIFQKNCQ